LKSGFESSLFCISSKLKKPSWAPKCSTIEAALTLAYSRAFSIFLPNFSIVAVNV